MNRRQTLALGLGVASLPVFGRRARGGRVGDLSERLCLARRDDVLEVAADAIRAGAGKDELLEAVFVAGLESVRPRPHGILHCVMEVEANFQLADASAPREELFPVLFNLDDFKRSQARDADEGDWNMPAPPVVRFSSDEAALKELRAALDDWDPERADRALVGALGFADSPEKKEALLETLWPLGLRCYAFIGHKAIYATSVERVLRRLAWRPARPALRSLCMTTLVDRNTQDYEHALGLIERFPADWSANAEEPDFSAEVFQILRESTPQEAQIQVVEWLADGLGPRTIWDGIRLLGAELFLKRPGITSASGRNALLPVHAVTVPGALAHIQRRSTVEATRRLALLQAAAWGVRLRDDLASMVQLSLDGASILELGLDVEPPTDLRELMSAPDPRHARAFLEAGDTELCAAYARALRHSLFRRGREHHQHKYAAAALEEAALADPRWRSRMLAAGVEYLASPDDPETELYSRSVKALRSAGRL